MAEELLNRADIVPVLEKMGGEAVTKGVAGDTLGNREPDRCIVHGTLDHRLVDVMTASLTRRGIAVGASGWKDELPLPLAGRAGILPHESGREQGVAVPARQVVLVNLLRIAKLALKRLEQRVGQNRHPILPPLSRTHEQLATRMVEILHPQLKRLKQAKTSTIQETGDQLRNPAHLIEHTMHVVAIEHLRQPPRALRDHDTVERIKRQPQDVAVEKYQGRTGLVLRRGADLFPHRKRRKKFPNLVRAKRPWMAPPVKHNESAHPGGVGLLGTATVVQRPHSHAELVEERWSRGLFHP